MKIDLEENWKQTDEDVLWQIDKEMEKGKWYYGFKSRFANGNRKLKILVRFQKAQKAGQKK